MLTPRKKQKVIQELRLHETDTGSAEVQIGLLTKQIQELTDHLKKHQKDNHSRRGLLKMVGQRRRLLTYLRDNNEKGYNRMTKKFDLKF
jgi:small subunit ribosomal protein S15